MAEDYKDTEDAQVMILLHDEVEDMRSQIKVLTDRVAAEEGRSKSRDKQSYGQWYLVTVVFVALSVIVGIASGHADRSTDAVDTLRQRVSTVEAEFKSPRWSQVWTAAMRDDQKERERQAQVLRELVDTLGQQIATEQARLRDVQDEIIRQKELHRMFVEEWQETRDFAEKARAALTALSDSTTPIQDRPAVETPQKPTERVTEAALEDLIPLEINANE